MKGKQSQHIVGDKVHFDGLVTEVAHRMGVSKGKADEFIRETFSAIKDFLYHQKQVDVVRFGVFFLSIYKGRAYSMPEGETIWKPDRLIPRLRYSTKFKEDLGKIQLEEPDKEENDIDDIMLE